MSLFAIDERYLIECPICKGQGFFGKPKWLGNKTCFKCGGHGKVFNPKYRCGACKGHGLFGKPKWLGNKTCFKCKGNGYKRLKGGGEK